MVDGVCEANKQFFSSFRSFGILFFDLYFSHGVIYFLRVVVSLSPLLLVVVLVVVYG
jgi:hypothetical protein